jgi:hypothetical protein
MDMVLGAKWLMQLGHLCHKPPRTIYGIQMAREELQIIWVKSLHHPLKELTNLTLLLQNKPHKYSKTNPESR